VTNDLSAAAALHEPAPGFAELGLVAFTTTRQAGSFGLVSDEPSAAVWGRWLALAASLAPRSDRLAFAHQVHGRTVVEHVPGWRGLLRASDADGHLDLRGATAMAVTLADCVPVFIGHPSGVAGIVHSGWKGTVARIVAAAIARFVDAGMPPRELVVHCGPAICGQCYLVGREVYGQLTGESVDTPTPVDLRALIAGDARRTGVTKVTVSDSCTRCDNDRFFSHRCGDAGRQLGVIVSRARG
jgi:YfiH family protein